MIVTSVEGAELHLADLIARGRRLRSDDARANSSLAP